MERPRRAGELDGKVAIVTGAGRGLGRTEALELARLGASVVVNDLGRTLHGEPEASDRGAGNLRRSSPGPERPDRAGKREASAADAVVDEITAGGAKAVAHPGDVADWDAAADMVRTAVETFGGLDILVNNAGFLRDRMIFNMSEEEFDAVIRVHLKGHFCMSRHATAYWRDRSKAAGEPVYGRVVNTASEAGLVGSPGQPNYAAAKGAIVQLTLATANACGRYGVTANAIAPRALTRMTEALPGFDASEEGFDVFAPENVSPLVAYLASPAAGKVTGQVFVVYGRMIDVLAGPAVDRRFETGDRWTPATVGDTLTPFYEQREPLRDGFAFGGTRG